MRRRSRSHCWRRPSSRRCEERQQSRIFAARRAASDARRAASDARRTLNGAAFGYCLRARAYGRRRRHSVLLVLGASGDCSPASPLSLAARLAMLAAAALGALSTLLTVTTLVQRHQIVQLQVRRHANEQSESRIFSRDSNHLHRRLVRAASRAPSAPTSPRTTIVWSSRRLFRSKPAAYRPPLSNASAAATARRFDTVLATRKSLFVVRRSLEAMRCIYLIRAPMSL